MTKPSMPIKVLYSFPHKLGANRICTVAWYQAEGAAAAGAEVIVFAGSICRPLSPQIKVHTTLAWKRLRIPYRLLGTRRSCILHDWLVARQLPQLVGKIDLIHVWPLGAKRTLQMARKLGIPTVLERPNAHTQYAYEIVQQECRKLGISMPPGHEHDYDPKILAREEEEYALADHLLCPSDFVARTFLDRGFPPQKLARHQYGHDEKKCYPNSVTKGPGLTFLFAAGCAPRKGLHFALQAWLQSSAHKDGTFLVVGEFIPGYAEILSAQLAHPSVKVLGYRKDLPDLMRQSDVFVLPSIEEGSALVTSDARGCGCVLLVSEAAGAICSDKENALVHAVGDVATLTQHMNLLNDDRSVLSRLRESSLKTVNELTWSAASSKLSSIYKSAVRNKTENVGATE